MNIYHVVSVYQGEHGGSVASYVKVHKTSMSYTDAYAHMLKLAIDMTNEASNNEEPYHIAPTSYRINDKVPSGYVISPDEDFDLDTFDISIHEGSIDLDDSTYTCNNLRR